MLTPEELQWIGKRMEWYDIKYQEVYDEVSDHIITGIEAARAAGDKRNIENVYQTVVDSHFGGYLGIDKIAEAYEKAYRKKIAKLLNGNYRYYINWQALLLTVLLTLAGFYFPHTKATSLVMIFGLFAAAMVPAVYGWRNARMIKTDKGKKSIVKDYVLAKAYLLFMMLCCLLNLSGLTVRHWHINISTSYILPVVMIPLFYLFIIYGLSVIRLCKQEFKIAE